MILTILKIVTNFFLTIFTTLIFLTISTIVLKQYWGLVTFETLITILTIENLNIEVDDNLCYQTIKKDSGKHV